ncbi:MAG TPA: 4Fe-4S dicluster domain-containing protein [Candidatus Baltobacteraceae bacterium]|nr:4Fe-4S dicluster domain-containing protein [Candidatus Baltobacteraceae bacterium]
MPQVAIDRDRCKGCEHCIRACPQGILALSRELNGRGVCYATVAEPWRCLGCRLCGIACPDLAIELQAGSTIYRYFDY